MQNGKNIISSHISEINIWQVFPRSISVQRDDQSYLLKLTIEEIIEAIKEIGMSYPEHFATSIAIDTIPKDAKTQNTYIAQLRNKVVGFLVATETQSESEVLWLATAKSHRNCGIGSALLDYFEDIQRNRKPRWHKFIVKLSAPDSDFNENRFPSQEWTGTRAFYKKLGYVYECTLIDYWNYGENADLFVKRCQGSISSAEGYIDLACEEIIAEPAYRLNHDKHSEENKAIQRDIRQYLAYFGGVETQISHSRKNIELDFPKGVTGIVFRSGSSSIVTIFANITDAEAGTNIDSEIEQRFEFDYRASALTKIIEKQNLTVGAVYYNTVCDQESEIKIGPAYRDYVDPSYKDSNGYSIFFNKIFSEQDDDISYVCLYYIGPIVNNPTSYKYRWREHVVSSLFCLKDIKEILDGLNKSTFHGNAYLKRLQKCMHLPASVEALDTIANKYIDMTVHSNTDTFLLASNHDLKSLLRSSVIGPLSRISDNTEKITTMKIIDRCISNVERYSENLEIMLSAFNQLKNVRNRVDSTSIVLDEKLANSLINKDFFLRYFGLDKYEDIDGISVLIVDTPLYLHLPEGVLKLIIQTCISNAVDAFVRKGFDNNDIKIEIKLREIESRIEFQFTSYDLTFSQDAMNYGGIRPLTRTAGRGGTGMGMFILENILRMVNAAKAEDNRHFKLENKRSCAQLSFKI
ncbi:MAG: GNAT family N-acetyltransferase [Candidatus Thiodiazotropha endolucinida]|nr:GNAT family N-acetyltransferase [Candidatus Thiodiazotropha endolucinida]